MNKNHKIITWSVVIILLLSGLAAVFYFSYIIYSVEEAGITLKVGESVKKGPENRLDLGTMPPGSRAERILSLSHKHSKPLTVHISVYGELSDWTEIEKNDILVEPGESAESRMVFEMPADAEEGTYDGKIKMYFKRT